MTRTTPPRCRSRARLAQLSSEITGMLDQLEMRRTEENQGGETFEAAASAWQREWDANRSRIDRQMGLLSALKEGWAGMLPTWPHRPRLSVVGRDEYDHPSHKETDRA